MIEIYVFDFDFTKTKHGSACQIYIKRDLSGSQYRTGGGVVENCVFDLNSRHNEARKRWQKFVQIRSHWVH